jgi:hypothetical protein
MLLDGHFIMSLKHLVLVTESIKITALAKAVFGNTFELSCVVFVRGIVDFIFIYLLAEGC